MIRSLLLFLLLTAGCSYPQSKRIDIILMNTTGKEIKVRATSMGFTRDITLCSKEIWHGWIPRMHAKSATIEITEER